MQKQMPQQHRDDCNLLMLLLLSLLPIMLSKWQTFIIRSLSPPLSISIPKWASARTHQKLSTMIIPTAVDNIFLNKKSSLVVKESITTISRFCITALYVWHIDGIPTNMAHTFLWTYHFHRVVLLCLVSSSCCCIVGMLSMDFINFRIIYWWARKNRWVWSLN